MDENAWINAVILIHYMDQIAEKLGNGIFPLSKCEAGKEIPEGRLAYNDLRPYPDHRAVMDAWLDENGDIAFTTYERYLSKRLGCLVKVRVQPDKADGHVLLDAAGQTFRIRPGSWKPIEN